MVVALEWRTCLLLWIFVVFGVFAAAHSPQRLVEVVVVAPRPVNKPVLLSLALALILIAIVPGELGDDEKVSQEE